MENYTPEWRTMTEIPDAIRRARLVVLDANEVRLISIEYRHRAAVLRKEAQRLRQASSASRTSTTTLHGTSSPSK
jgi:hypothetical protein